MKIEYIIQTELQHKEIILACILTLPAESPTTDFLLPEAIFD